MTVDVALNNYETWLTEIDKSSASYPYDDRWNLVSLSTSFFQNDTIKILARKRPSSNPLFLKLVRKLPKTDYLIHKLKFQGLVEWFRPFVPTVLTVTYWKRVRKFNK